MIRFHQIGMGHYTGGDWGSLTSTIYSTKDGGCTWKTEDDIPFGVRLIVLFK